MQFRIFSRREVTLLSVTGQVLSGVLHRTDFHDTTKEYGLPALENQFLDLNRYVPEESSISWSGTPNDEDN